MRAAALSCSGRPGPMAVLTPPRFERLGSALLLATMGALLVWQAGATTTPLTGVLAAIYVAAVGPAVALTLLGGLFPRLHRLELYHQGLIAYRHGLSVAVPWSDVALLGIIEHQRVERVYWELVPGARAERALLTRIDRRLHGVDGLLASTYGLGPDALLDCLSTAARGQGLR